MRKKQNQVKQRIVEAAYESFWRSGFKRTTVDSIAARAGLTKRTVYAYFRSKDDLLAAVLHHYREMAMARLKHIEGQLPVDRYAMIDSFFSQLAGWASTTPRWSGSGLTRLVVELAELPGHPARAIAKKAKAMTETWLAERLVKARVSQAAIHAREIMLLMEGAMALMLIHGDRSYIDAAADAAKQLIRRRYPANMIDG
jgi:AcrR family transcriptional regulator